MVVRLFSSFRTTIVLLVLYAVLLATATWIEKDYGTVIAKDLVYYSPFFFVLQVLMVVNFLFYAYKHHYLTSRRLGLLFTHFSFIVILLGATITHFFGEEGLLHLREGEVKDCMLVRQENGLTTEVKLPFTVRLDDFEVKRYPGSGSPSSYESHVTICIDKGKYKAHIYMNNVLDVDGYRLYQASFDTDERGSVLSVNHDMAGRNVTYMGYVLLFIGLICSLLGPGTRFRWLSGRLAAMKDGRMGMMLLLFFVSMGGKEAFAIEALKIAEQYRIDEKHAARFGLMPVQSSDGRMKPVNTFSSEVLRKLCKTDHIGTFNADQFLLSLLLMPDVWAEIPCIAIDNAELASQYGLSVPHVSFNKLFDAQGNYKLRKELETIYRKAPAHRSHLEKDILKLDEQANVFHLLMQCRMLNIFPLQGDANHTWYAPGDDLSVFQGKDSMFVSRIFDWYLEEVVQAAGGGDWTKADEVLDMIETYQHAKATGVDITRQKMELEVKYNQLKVFSLCRVGYLLLGGLSLLWVFGTLFGICRRRWMKWLLVVGVLLVFHFHMYGLGVRWYIGGYAPWSNSYETMVYVALATVFAGLLFIRHNMLVFSLAVLFGGVILFVSGLNWMDPQITPLVPVLKSPWLMFHVAVIVAAYGFFCLGCMVGMVNLLLMSVTPYCKQTNLLMGRGRELTMAGEMVLWIGLVLMTVGTFLGAVWANESWGRYWGWDPKETWALITIIIYVFVTHIHLLKWRMTQWLFNFLSVLAFSSVLMTFFGVNYFLSGMHSYGQNEQISNLFVWIGVAYGLVLLLGGVSFHVQKNYLNSLVSC